MACQKEKSVIWPELDWIFSKNNPWFDLSCQLHNKYHDEGAVAAIVHNDDDHNNG